MDLQLFTSQPAARCALIALGVVSHIASASAQEFIWAKTAAPEIQWQFLVSSSDATKLVGASYGPRNEIYRSTNAGKTWAACPTPQVIQWSCGVSSADGQRLYAAVGNGVLGGIYASENGGSFWYKTAAPDQNWMSVAASADGMKLLAAAGGSTVGGGVYLSTNSGTSWTPIGAMSNGIGRTFYVAMSQDGSRCVAAQWTNGIYVSDNSGMTWTKTSAPAKAWRCVSSSADGTKLVAGVFDGGIWSSVNSGITWSETGAPTGNWHVVVSSADGTNLAAMQVTGIYTSTNAGTTWVRSNEPRKSAWWSLTSSSDGTRLAATLGKEGIFVAVVKTNPPTIDYQPEIVAACLDASLTLSPRVAGTPPMSFQWSRDGILLTDDTNMAGTSSSTLWIQNLSITDLGSYQLWVSNAVGTMTSKPMAVVNAPVAAKVKPIVANGFVVGALITDGGCGYTNTPFVVFSGESGIGAAGYGQVYNGSVTNIVITAAGSRYSSNAVGQVAPPYLPRMHLLVTNSPTARATPVVLNGFIIGASIIEAGNDYASPPPVNFIDTSGKGAAGYAEIYQGEVTNIVITSAGTGYTAGTKIDIPPAATRNAVIPSATDVMLGQAYVLELAVDDYAWNGNGGTFVGTNAVWQATRYWLLHGNTQQLFRLRVLP